MEEQVYYKIVQKDERTGGQILNSILKPWYDFIDKNISECVACGRYDDEILDNKAYSMQVYRVQNDYVFKFLIGPLECRCFLNGKEITEPFGKLIYQRIVNRWKEVQMEKECLNFLEDKSVDEVLSCIKSLRSLLQ